MSDISHFDVGDLVRITGTFTDINGTETDPDIVRFKFEDPSGNPTTDTFGDVGSSTQKSSVGVYYYDLDLDESGKWHYRFEGESNGGQPQGAAETSLYARSTVF